MRSTHRHLTRPGYGLGVACVLAVLLSPPLAAQDAYSYGFIRVVEGYADLVQAASGTQVEAIANYPLLVGDQLRLAPGARLEAVLPDGSYLRLGESSELRLSRVALSADSEDDSTLLELLQGEMQLVLQHDASRDEAYRIDTANASVYLERRGSYRLFTDGESWTEVVVRHGFAEVVTERGSAVVRASEQTVVDGSSWPRVSVQTAGPPDSLERWGDRLLAEARVAEQPRYVDASLSYAAAPLYRHGSWVQVGGGYAWRPHVSIGWRPYHAGWWYYTPSGLTWISTEPWGWLTYHYGVWDYAPAYGWLWYPGPVYTPAAVYWYWGPSHVGWIPAGYYSRYYGYGYPYWHHYRRPGYGFHVGIYGWAGGRAGWWSDWTFCSYRHFGRRDAYSHLRTGAQLTRQGAFSREVPRGVIASDTRGVRPELWNQPTAVIQSLKQAHLSRQSSRGASDLPDVSAWVARQRELPESLARAVAPAKELAGATPRRIDGADRSRAAADRPGIEVDRSGAPVRRSGAAAMESRRPESTARSGATRERESRPPAAVPGRSATDAAADWRLGRDAAVRRPVERGSAASEAPRSTLQRPRAERPQLERSPARAWEPRVRRDDSRTVPEGATPRAPVTRSPAPRASGSDQPPVVRRVWEDVRSHRLKERRNSPRPGLQRPDFAPPAAPRVDRGPQGLPLRAPSAGALGRAPSRPAAPGPSVSPRGPSRVQPNRPAPPTRGPSRVQPSRPSGSGRAAAPSGTNRSGGSGSRSGASASRRPPQ